MPKRLLMLQDSEQLCKEIFLPRNRKSLRSDGSRSDQTILGCTAIRVFGAGTCGDGCTNSCRGCGSGCSGSCYGDCDGGCKGTCTVTCGYNGCVGNCYSSCSNGCAGDGTAASNPGKL